MVIIVTVLFACKYWISPSGFPPLQVINADGTVNVMLFPVIVANTLLSRTLAPKLVHDGRLNVVADVQP